MSRLHGIVPPYLLERLAEAAREGILAEPQAAEDYLRTLEQDARLRAARERGTGDLLEPRALPEPRPDRAAAVGPQRWTVHTARNATRLPGQPVRDETDGTPSGDVAVDEAWEGVRATLEMLAEVYERDSYDDAGARALATVHYGRSYSNAFWDGRQLVLGDGDGRVFQRFTKAVDVMAHELGHAVIEHTAGLVYRGQPGALNESVADVIGACLKQRVLGQTAEEGDWLIGAGLFAAGIDARALRSMSEPGTAYDDPRIGRDPQPGHMDDYVVTSEDNGGVHINSGIPNRAFYLAATAIGGSAAEGAGRIWYDALRTVDQDVSFDGFAQATVAAAGAHADAVRSAWAQVGIEVADGGPVTPPDDVLPQSERPVEGRSTVVVRRSGGFAGLALEAVIDLDDDGDPRTPEVRYLVRRINFTAVAQDLGGEPDHPDAFVYTILAGGERLVVPERDVTPELQRLVELALEERG